MLCFLVLTAVTFSLFGFIIGLWADDFQKLQLIPLMVVMPLTFLGGAFYSIKMLPPVWQTVTLFRSEEHTSELQSLMRISYAVFCLKKKTKSKRNTLPTKYTNTQK